MRIAAAMMIVFDVLTLEMFDAATPYVLITKIMLVMMMYMTSHARMQRRRIISQGKASTETDPVNDAHNVHDDTHDDVQDTQDAAWPFKGNNRFAGMNVVIAGTLKEYTWEQAQKIITDNGGYAFRYMPNKCDLVVIGDEPDAAIVEAAVNVKAQIMSEFDFSIKARQPLVLTLQQFADLVPLMA